MEIELKYTKIFEQNNTAWLSGKRRALNEGGTYSSKTWSILQLLNLIARHAKSSLKISVVSESLPHLKKGAIYDFFRILGESEDNNPRWNKTDHIYTFNPGVILEFFGADESAKVRGPRRDILFLNEGNNVPWEAARGLDIRTEKFTFVDWNPVSEFWAHENWVGEEENAYIHSTYLDAPDVVSEAKRKDIESQKDKDPNWWNIYGLGLLGKVTGLVYPKFSQVDKLPEGNLFYGLDFGFLGDPTVLVKNVIIGDNLYSQQMFYRYDAMTNDDICRELHLSRVTDIIYPDPSEPKSAEEIRRKGFNVGETVKGPGSVEFGIKSVNSYYQHWTKDSLECIKEQRNHRYIMKREPNTGREYLSDAMTHQWSHGLDARRYGVASHVPNASYSTKATSYI